MGEHLGYRATREPNGAFKGWAWDPTAKRYRRKSGHRTEAHALKWAKDEHAKFITKLESLAREPTAKIAADYRRWLEEVKKRSGSHLRNVKRCLDGLAKVMPDPAHPRARQQCEEWLAKLPLSARTKQQYLVTAKSAMNWGELRGYLGSNPLAIAETEEPEDYLRPQYTIDELRTIVSAADDRFHLRACFMVYLGLRLQEAVYIRPQDLDRATRMAAVKLDTGAQVKRRKERLVPIPSELLVILEYYGDWYDPTLKVGNAGKKLEQFLKRVGIEKRDRDNHSFRHSYAGLQTATGVPSNMLAAYMGHASTATTREYDKLAPTYQHQVQGWTRGEFRLLEGATCALPGAKTAVA